MRILKTMLSRFVKVLAFIINPANIEGCPRLPRGLISTTDNKIVVVKFVNRKHSKLMLRSVQLARKVKYTLIIRYVLIKVIFGENAKICKGKTK